MTKSKTLRLAHAVNVGGLLLIAAVIAMWWLCTIANLFDAKYLPSPPQVVSALWTLLGSGAMYSALGHTAKTTGIATAAAVASGVLFGIIMGLSPAVRLYCNSTVDFLRTMPLTALLPVSLLIWGPSSMAEIAIAWYAAVWPVLISTAGGIRAIPPRFYEVARILRFGQLRTIRRVVMPATTAAILVGARIGAVSALVMSIVAEMLIDPHGLGWNLVVAQDGIRPDQVWAYTVLIGTLAYVFNRLLVWAVGRAVPGAMQQQRSR